MCERESEREEAVDGELLAFPDEAPAFACWFVVEGSGVRVYRGTSLKRNSPPPRTALGP